MILAIVFASLVVLVAANVPIAVAIGIVGALGHVWTTGPLRVCGGPRQPFAAGQGRQEGQRPEDGPGKQ